MWVMEGVVTLAFLGDILFNLNLEIRDEVTGEAVQDRWVIAKSYL
jgi:hypothetical protein